MAWSILTKSKFSEVELTAWLTFLPKVKRWRYRFVFA